VAFGSLIFNQSPSDQLRLYFGAQRSLPGAQQADLEAQGSATWRTKRCLRQFLMAAHGRKRGRADGLALLSLQSRSLPGRHTGVSDPNVLIPEDDRGSNYVGGVVSVCLHARPAQCSCGLQVFGQRDNQLFGSRPAMAP